MSCTCFEPRNSPILFRVSDISAVEITIKVFSYDDELDRDSNLSPTRQKAVALRALLQPQAR